MVEVVHDDLKALIFLAKQVLHRDLDILKFNVGRAGQAHTLCVNLTDANTWEGLFNQNGGNTRGTGAASANRYGEIISPDTIGDPLFDTINNVVLSVRSLFGGSFQAGNMEPASGSVIQRQIRLSPANKPGRILFFRAWLPKVNKGGNPIV